MLQVEVVIETPEGTSGTEHARREGWVVENLLDANRSIRGVYTMTIIRSENGDLVSFAGHGDTPSEATERKIRELREAG